MGTRQAISRLNNYVLVACVQLQLYLLLPTALQTQLVLLYRSAPTTRQAQVGVLVRSGTSSSKVGRHASDHISTPTQRRP